jgi:hypothetical protein
MRIAGIAAGLAVVFIILRVAQTPNAELAHPMFILTIIVLGAAGYASWRAYEAIRRIATPSACPCEAVRPFRRRRPTPRARRTERCQARARVPGRGRRRPHATTA